MSLTERSMADHRLLGLPTVWALGTTAQAARRLTPEWCSMSRDERKEEILAYVEAAGKSDFVKDPIAQAKAIAESFLVDLPGEWPYWVATSEEQSQKGWFAWHVVRAIVRHLWREDRESVTKPPLGDWLSGFLEDPTPSRGTGVPKGSRDRLRRVAVSGVYALVDAGLCDVTGKKKGGGSSACDLVAARLDASSRTVYNAWRDHRRQLAKGVDELIVLEADPENCPAEVIVRACATIGGENRLFASTVEEAWRKDGTLVEHTPQNFGKVLKEIESIFGNFAAE